MLVCGFWRAHGAGRCSLGAVREAPRDPTKAGTMQHDARPSLRDVIRPAALFAAPLAALGLARVAIAVGRGSAPVSYLFVVPIVGFAFFFGTALLLQLSGVVARDPSNPLRLNVNQWFAWLVGGGLVLFFVGLLARGSDVLATDAPRVGLLCALAWAGLVALAWLCVRLFAKRGA